MFDDDTYQNIAHHKNANLSETGRGIISAIKKSAANAAAAVTPANAWAIA